jgi:glycosyltransferase involved in cell wall biosynthesis
VKNLKVNTLGKIINITNGEKNIDKIILSISLFDKLIKKTINNNLKYNVSVVVTNYNREKIIEKCLESLLIQKNGEVSYEVVIIDDCSTDNSCLIINNFIKNHKLDNFRLIERNYNSGGPSLPRNDGIELSLGEYIFIIDSDDSINELAIKNGYEFSKMHDSDVCLLKKIAKNRGGYAEQVFNTGTIGRADFFKNKLYYNPQVTCFFNKKFLLKNKILFNVEHNIIEDLIFISNCFSKTDKVSILSDKDYYYLSEISGDNISILGNGGIDKSLNAFMTSLNYYLIVRDVKKYSSFINILIEFIEPWLKSKIDNKEKIKIIDTFSAIIDSTLIDFQYILPKNLNKYFKIKEKKYTEYLDF